MFSGKVCGQQLTKHYEVAELLKNARNIYECNVKLDHFVKRLLIVQV